MRNIEKRQYLRGSAHLLLPIAPIGRKTYKQEAAGSSPALPANVFNYLRLCIGMRVRISVVVCVVTHPRIPLG